MRRVRGIVSVFSICLIACVYSCETELGKGMYKDYTIGLNKNRDSLYIKASMWGVAGNHIQIFISPYSFSSRYFDSALCIKYYEPTIYYRVNGDTLELYPTMKADVPNIFNPKVSIKQIVIDKLKDIHDYKENYKKYGLEKISVYE